MYTAIDAAAAMQSCVEDWSQLPTVIKVDPTDECVAFQQAFCCVVFSVYSPTPVKVVQAYALPPSFITVDLAQQVRP